MSDNTLAALAFDAAPVGLVLAEHRIIKACNQTFCALSGFTHKELISNSFRILYENDAAFEKIRNIGLSTLKSGDSYSDQRLLRCKDGSPIWCRFRAQTLTLDDPLARTVMSYAKLDDITDRPVLTPREGDVVKGLSQGQTSKQIAANLGLSTRTVKDVRARLLRKFNVRNAAEMLAKFTNIEL